MMIQPTLILTCGAQCTGKSTWAKQYISENPKVVYLSTDDVRKELTGSEADQSANHLIFPLIKSRAEASLSNKQSVLVDGTFIKKAWRKDFVDIGRKLNVSLVVHVFTADRETLISRLQQRISNGGLNVPVEAIDKYLKQFEAPTEEEFDLIIGH